MKPTTYTHPNPKIHRLTLWFVFILLWIVLLTVPLQIAIAVIYPPAMLFYLSAIVTLTLVAPLILYLMTTPTVSVDEQGITVYPFIGKPRHVDWEHITDIKEYPLLPRRGQEVNKRILVGREQYQRAEGIMLISPQFPMLNSVGGFFTGEYGRKIIALTNRTHIDYDRLSKQVMKYSGKASLRK
jgi:hypothetical protein